MTKCLGGSASCPGNGFRIASIIVGSWINSRPKCECIPRHPRGWTRPIESFLKPAGRYHSRMQLEMRPVTPPSRRTSKGYSPIEWDSLHNTADVNRALTPSRIRVAPETSTRLRIEYIGGHRSLSCHLQLDNALVLAQGNSRKPMIHSHSFTKVPCTAMMTTPTILSWERPTTKKLLIRLMITCYLRMISNARENWRKACERFE